MTNQVDERICSLLRIALLIWCALIIWTLLLLASCAAAERDPAQVRSFRKSHPCPATGQTDGACPDYVVDHVWSLCLGGPDIPENMKWQRKAESYIKDNYEREMCAMKRKLEAKPLRLTGPRAAPPMPSFVPGTKNTWTDGVNKWAGNPFCARSGFLLGPRSAAIDRGVNVNLPVDIYGSAPDIGACEFMPAGGSVVSATTVPQRPTMNSVK